MPPRVLSHHFTDLEVFMSENGKHSPELVRIDLTEEQKTQIKHSIGKDADAIELNAQELEERIAPRAMIDG